MYSKNFKTESKRWQEWGVIIPLFITLEIAIISIERARWITPQPSLTFVLILSILTAWWLSRKKLPAAIMHPLVLILGAVVTIWQASSLLPRSETISRVGQLFLSLQSWWQAAVMAQPSDVTIHFAVFLIFFTWVMGYISTWFALKRQNVWIGVSLGLITVLVNLSNLTEYYYRFFFLYALAALLLVGITEIVKRYYRSGTGVSHYSRRGILYLLTALSCFSLLIVWFAMLTPEVRFTRLETMVNSRTLWGRSLYEYFDNILSSIPAKQPFIRSDEQDELLFGDSSFAQGDQLQLIVVSEQSLYWRTRMFDNYTLKGWTSSNSTERILRGRNPVNIDGLSKRDETTYSVTPVIKTDVLVTGGEFVSSSIPVSVQTLAPQSNSSIEISEPTSFRSRPISNEIVAVSSVYALRPDRRYAVTTSISTATPEDLAGAGDSYPAWVTDYYLKLPPAFPERVRQLSAAITREETTAYDKAMTILQFLSHIKYEIEVDPPPEGVDGVEYFLFTEQTGNCVQFSSSMAVMLRSVGVPTRISVGYAPGERDEASGTSFLTSEERHAWPEIYFPGYGWIGFEPTPGITNEPLQLVELDSTGAGQISGEELDALLEEEIGSGGVVRGSSGSTSNGSPGLTLLFIVVGSVLLLFVLRGILTRRRRNPASPDYAGRIYRRMCLLASLDRLAPRPQQTPLEYGAILSSAFPGQSEALDSIIHAYIERQYSPRKELSHWDMWRLQQSWRNVRNRLIKRFFQVKYWFSKTAGEETGSKR